MFKKNFLFVLILFVFAICFSCVKNESVKKDVDLSIGKIMTFEFGSNPTTGFDWVYEIGNGDGMIELVDNKYDSEANEDRVGAGGIRTFVFKGTKEGKQAITFTYKRNWEGGETSCDVVYEIEIDKDLNITYLEKHKGVVEISRDLDSFPNPSFSEK